MTWLPIGKDTPKDEWILLKGGTTSEDNYCDDLSEEDLNRPVVGKFDHPYNNDFFNGESEWKFCYWDGDWRTHYYNPTHWKRIE